MVEMTPTPRDPSLPGDLEKFDRRAQIWLWSYLQLRHNSRLFNPAFEVQGEFQKQVNEAIRQVPTPNLPRSLASLYNQTTLNKSHFQWIKSSNERLLNWLARQTKGVWPITGISQDHHLPCAVEDTLPPQLLLREKIILGFDLSGVSLDEKERRLTQLNREWGALKAEVRRLINWLERSDSEQHEWVLNYIRRNDKFRAISGIPELSNSYDTILSWFECSPEHPAKRELFLRTMGQRWSQAKYKKKLRGKQRNFILTKETDNQLNKLKKIWGVSRNKVIERLIQAESRAQKEQLSGSPETKPIAPASDKQQQDSEEGKLEGQYVGD